MRLLLMALAWLASAAAAGAVLSRLQLRRKSGRLGSAVRRHRGKQLGEFLGYVLFSVREYLTSVASVTEQIAMASPDAAVKELCGKLQRVVAELNGKLGRMLDSAQTSTSARAGPGEFDLKELLAACLEAAAFPFPDRAARARVWSDPQLGPLCGDRDTIACVLTSVLANSVEALEAAGVPGGLAVSARLDGSFAEVDVVDDGGGIPPEYADKVFSPLFTTKGSSGGLGLGLSMSRRMMERCGGSLSVQSEGRRTTARIRIPLKPALPVIRGEEATWPGRRKSA